MSAKKTSPYGAWKSPIKGGVPTSGSTQIGELTTDGDKLYWLELHPEQEGRYALCTCAKGEEAHEVVPEAYNVRTRVHEYGGGSYVTHSSTIYFSNFKDQLVYRLEAKGQPAPITKEGLRYADYLVDEKRRRLIGVREDHTAGRRLPTNTIASVAIDGSSETVLISGNDFYSSPRIDPSGSRIAWITWNFPNMPWDGTELWTGEFAADGSIANLHVVCGGANESVVMPQWSPGGVLYFLSDRSGFWNIYRWTGGSLERVCSIDADMATPHWSFGMSTYAFESEERIVSAFTRNGTWHIGLVDTTGRKLKTVKTPYTDIGYVRAAKGEAFFLGGSPSEPYSVIHLDLKKSITRVVHRPKVVPINERFLSKPRHVQFRTTGGKRAYAFLYMPKNLNFKPPKGTKPPLLVIGHGGPTAQARTFLSPGIQAWTSRGFAVLDVNYGGSSGYGREYRERLTGQWGIVDVDDCCNGALSLVRKGMVDGKRLGIRGGSAGGYTTLCALAFRKTFRVGASYYGISDAEALARDTHKFESRYVDKLIAPYPEGRQTYRERSALYFADRISAPMIFFQGLEDVVVPPNQAETMVKSLRERGVPVAYFAFEGEQHGFRRAETIERAFEAELYFYSKVFGFNLPEAVEKVEIWNFPSKH